MDKAEADMAGVCINLEGPLGAAELVKSTLCVLQHCKVEVTWAALTPFHIGNSNICLDSPDPRFFFVTTTTFEVNKVLYSGKKNKQSRLGITEPMNYTRKGL